MDDNSKALAPLEQGTLSAIGVEIRDQLTLSNAFFQAGCFGSDVKNVHQAFVKIMAGKEMGMAPLESMNSLLIVNGHISIWGTATAKRLREHGWMISYKDEDASGVTAVIKKGDEVHEFRATASDVERLNSQAFKRSPKDKLRWHALGRLIRFSVPEVLGPVRYLTEEAEDIVMRPSAPSVDVTNTALDAIVAVAPNQEVDKPAEKPEERTIIDGVPQYNDNDGLLGKKVDPPAPKADNEQPAEPQTYAEKVKKDMEGMKARRASKAKVAEGEIIPPPKTGMAAAEDVFGTRPSVVPPFYNDKK